MAIETVIEPPLRHKDDGNFSEDELGLARLAAFSDGVFAIAITLLILDIRLPTLPENPTDAAFLDALWSIKDRYFAYLISFVVIGLYWMGHHRMFRYIVRYNTIFIALNLAALLFVAFLPFPTSLIAEYDNRPATIFYALMVAATGLIAAACWGYASGENRLTQAGLSRRTNRRTLLALSSIPALLLLSALVALWDPTIARWMWLVLFALIVVV